MKNDRLMTYSLRSALYGDSVTRIMAAALSAVHPGRAGPINNDANGMRRSRGDVGCASTYPSRARKRDEEVARNWI